MGTHQPDDLPERIRALRRLTRALCRSAHDGDDAAQGALVRALESGAWSMPVLRRLGQDRARSARRADARRRAREETQPSPAPDAGPAERAMRLELEERLIAQVRALPENQAEALYLRYWEDLSPRAIARRTGTTPDAVMGRLKRGMAALRAAMDADTPGGRERWLQILTPIAGGIVMTKKATLIGAGAAVLMAACALLLLRSPEPASREDAAGDAPGPRVIEVAHDAPGPAAVTGTTGSQRSAAGAEALVALRGRLVPTDGRAVDVADLDGTVVAAITNGKGHTTWKSLDVQSGEFSWTLAVNPEGQLVNGKQVPVAASLEAVADVFLLWPVIDGVGGVLFINDRGRRRARIDFELGAAEARDVPLYVPPVSRLTVTDLRTGAALSNVEVGLSRMVSHSAPSDPNGLALQPVTVQGDHPAVLVIERTGFSHPTSYVRAPGYAWRKLAIDFERGGHHFVELEPGGDLRVDFKGVAPEGTTVQATAVGTTSWGSKRSVDSADHMTWSAIPVGRWELIARRGDLEIGRCECLVTPGGLTEAELEFTELPPPLRAVGSGQITIPPAWQVGGMRIFLTPSFTSRDGTPQETTLLLSKLECIDDSTGVHRFDLPPMEPGRYDVLMQAALQGTPPGRSTYALVPRVTHASQFVLPETGSQLLDLRLPPPKRITIALVNAQSGESIDSARVTWSGWTGSERPTGPGSTQRMTSPDGRHELHVTSSMVRMTVSAEGFEPRTVEFNARLERSLELALDPETILEVRFLKENPEARFELRGDIEFGGDVGVIRVSREKTRAWLEGGGSALLTFPPIDGFLPVPPMGVEVPTGETTVVDVPLVRRSR